MHRFTPTVEDRSALTIAYHDRTALTTVPTMIESRTTTTVRRQRALACVLVGFGIVVALIAIGVVSGSAIATFGQPHAIDSDDRIGPDEPPENATYAVEITPRAPDDARVDVTISYDARSADELERARNDTLAAEWFQGEEIVREVMATRDRDADAIEHASTSYSVPRSDEANTVTIRYRVQWTDIPSADSDSDNVRFGPGFAAALDPGDEFRVSFPVERWEDWTVTRERPETVTHAEHVYSWTIGDDPDPEITLDRGAVAGESDDGDDALGMSLAVSLLALLLAGRELARRRRL
ncbi:hypothetical protein [Natronoglomus mannanivorans]|uniref:Uncharacterized protein n=1 Tax=Natronoglomus mannanivorans TaxID=2979990 RepID=A0AAP2Z057_9EURY|nr:hypothetical protein [Halobacteria archaeon AArc-xg1-1]